MPNIGLPELVLILVIVLLVFGAGKLPEIGKSLGKSIREFKKAKDENDEVPAKQPAKAVDSASK